MPFVRDEVHIKSFVDVMIQKLIVESSKSHGFEFFRANSLLLLFSGISVLFNTFKNFSELFVVGRVMLKHWVEISFKSNS